MLLFQISLSLQQILQRKTMSKQILKYKVREFQWFEMETKVRQMVQQLLMPFQKRTMENSTYINNLRQLTTQQATKLQELWLMVTNSPKNKTISIFKQIDNRFQQQTKTIMELKNLVAEQTKMIQKRFILQDERLKQNGQILLNNMQLKERVNEQIRQQNQNIIQFRNSLQSMIAELSSQFTKNYKQQQQHLKKADERYRYLDDRIRELQKHKKISEQKFANNDTKHSEFQKNNIHVQEQLKRIDRELQSLSQNLAYTKKLSNYVQQLEQKLKQQDFSLQTLTPLITQAQISDTFYSILPPKLRKRLVIQEYQKYSKLNNQVLENDFRKVKLKFRGMQMLEAVQKRNAREIIELKRRKLLAMGIDIDNVTYQQRQKYYRQVTFSEEFVDQVEDKIKIQSGIKQGDIRKLVESQLQNYQKQLTAKIRLELEDSKKYIYQMEQQLSRGLNDNLKKLELNQQSNEIFQTDQILENKHLTQMMNQFQKQNHQFNLQIKKMNQNMFSFIQFCSLVNHLQIQDELDKQSISLFGIKETFNETGQGKRVVQSQKKRIIDFDAQCFSCCGYPASTIAAFKMACLTYNPSQIVIENKEYKREQILEISTKILQFVKNKIIGSTSSTNLQTHIVPQDIYSRKQSGSGLQEDKPQNIKYYGTLDTSQRIQNKWRKTKRVNTSSNTRTINRAANKSQSRRKQELGNISYIFSENKRKNIAFLN